jgi:hypothetical protein
VKLLVRDGQRHQRPYDVVVRAGAKQDEALLSRDGEHACRLLVGGLFRCAVAHQLHSRHGAHDADVADDVVVGFPALHSLLEDRADAHGAFGQLLVAHDVHHGHPRGARDGIAAVGAAEAAGVGSIHHVGSPDDPGKRETGGQALGDSHEVGLHARVLDGEELAGASETALDLVGD